MEALKKLIQHKKISGKADIDQQTIFFIFNKVIQSELGNVGRQKIKPDYFSAKSKTIFVKSESSNWLGELWINKGRILERINKELNQPLVRDIKNK
jgi:hypothetical protein